MEEAAGLARLGRALWRRGWAFPGVGGAAVRLEDGLLVTPSGGDVRRLAPDDMVRVGLEGGGRPGPGYVAVYRAALSGREPGTWLVHGYPPAVCAFCLGVDGLVEPLFPEVALALGPVRLVPYRTPSHPQLADEVRAALAEAQAVLLQNGGALALGPGPEEALGHLALLERLSAAVLLARAVGPVLPLPPGEEGRLRRAFYRHARAREGARAADQVASEGEGE